MSKIIVNARWGLLFAAALTVATALSGGTAAHAATAAASSTPCSFGPAASCQSTDPAVTVNLSYSGASACTFSERIDWEDGSVTTSVITDPSDGYHSVGQHTYAKPGAYTIAYVGTVTSGDCTAYLGGYDFTLLPPPTPGSGPATGAAYVALGDSYSSGEGLGPFLAGTSVNSGAKQNKCHRSASGAYSDLSPAVVLPQVKNRAFWACSGATTEDMSNVPGTNGTPKQYGQPEQLTTVGSATKYITVTVGGDNIGFSDIGKACVTAEVGTKAFSIGKLSCSAQLKNSANALASLQTKLTTLYESLLGRAAPGAELVAAGYPQVLPSSFKGVGKLKGQAFCTFDHLQTVGTLGMLVTNAEKVAAFEVNLNKAIQGAVNTAASEYPGQVKYSDIYPTSVPRNCKGTTPNATVAGFELALGTGGGTGLGRFLSDATFHPTKAGQKVYAKAIENTFLSFTAVA